MRLAPALLGALLVLALPPPAPGGGPADRGAEELSHGAVAPAMHVAALNIPAGIRPGAWLQIGGANCTASFVVQDAAANLYLSTAAHCTSGAVGQRAALQHDAAVAAQGSMQEFGSVVVTWPVYEGYVLDAALIAIDADKLAQVDPTMTGWGGPTGLLAGIPSGDVVIRHYGWGWWTWMDHATRCRTGHAEPTGSDDWDLHTFWYSGQIGSGDSGSAVMTSDGLAVGILDWGGGIPTPTGLVGWYGGGERFDRALLAFGQALGSPVSLVTGGPVQAACQGPGA